MTTIESKKVIVDRPAEELYAFLQDMTNFKELLPEDRISEWEADENSCSFKVQGAATIGLRLAQSVPHSKICMESTDRAPFPFTLDVVLDGSNGSTSAQPIFQADINQFLKMMVEKPLKNLFDHIADRMVELHPPQSNS